MSKIKPWSFSALDQFVNCPRQYHEVKVLQAFKEDQNQPHLIWGNRVHKHFDDRQGTRVPLPPELMMHEPYMQRLESKTGELFFTERKVALTRGLQPCSSFARDVWWRGIIDYTKIDNANHKAFIADYKTGKVKPKFKQLSQFALHTFNQYPEVNLIDTEFYWTQTITTTKKTFIRDDIAALWEELMPDLTQYVEAFKTDVWQPRPSGLCSWCPVTSCEHWRPRRQ